MHSWKAGCLTFVWLDPGITPCCKTPKMPVTNFPQIEQSSCDRRSMRLQAVTEVACEFITNYVVPQTIVRSCWSVQKDFCNTIDPNSGQNNAYRPRLASP